MKHHLIVCRAQFHKACFRWSLIFARSFVILMQNARTKTSVDVFECMLQPIIAYKLIKFGDIWTFFANFLVKLI